MAQTDKHLIPYKYIDAENKVYNDSISISPSNNSSNSLQKPIITNSKSKSKTINSKLSQTEEEEEVDEDESSGSINYEELTDEEIRKLIEKKTNKIIKLNSTKDNLKQKLTNLIKKINAKISENAEILYKKEVNPIIIEKLVDHYETRKKSLQVEQKINHSYKCQFSLLKTKAGIENLDDKEINTDLTALINSGNKNIKTIEDQIKEIKEENKIILMQIKEIRDKKIPQQKEVELIDENNTSLKRKIEETQQLSLIKIEAINKFKTSQNKVSSILKEIEFAQEKILQYDKNCIDQDLLKDYLHWIELIKNELNKNQDNLVEMIKKGESEFINELKKRRGLKSHSVKKKKKNISIENNEQNIQNEDNIQKDKIEKNEENVKKDKIDKIDKNDKKEKKDKIDKNIKEEDNNKNQRKNIYNLLSILNNINLNEVKNNNNNKNQGNNSLTENINEANMKKENEKLKNMSNDLSILNSITESELRELMNKKEEYLDTNLRLDTTLKEYLKTKNNKLTSISKTIKSKVDELIVLKEKNSIIQEEINNLENVLQLSLEKEKIQKEIMEKMYPPDIINNETKKEVNNTINSTNEINKNDVKITSNNQKQEEISTDKNITIQENESRRELLQKIKKKYLEEEKEDDKKISEMSNINDNNKPNEDKTIESEKNKQDDNKIENIDKENINLEKSNENIENVVDNNIGNEMINVESGLKEQSEITDKHFIENNVSDDVEKELINNIEDNSNHIDYQQ